MSERCKSLGIPDHLFTNNRQIINTFSPEEEIYRRFKASGTPEDWIKDKQLSAAVFPVDEDSCNREKFSESCEDVLYNTRHEDEGNHYFDWGVLMFQAGELNQFHNRITEKGVHRDFVIELEHQPTECMYPHCIVNVLENGKKIDHKQPPRSIRALVRDILIVKSTVVKYPIIDN